MIQKNDWFRGDETGCDWFCKHSVWISKRIPGRAPAPLGSRLPLNSERSERTEQETERTKTEFHKME